MTADDLVVIVNTQNIGTYIIFIYNLNNMSIYIYL